MKKSLKIGDRVSSEIIGKFMEGVIIDISRTGVTIKLDEPHPLSGMKEIIKHKTEVKMRMK